MALINLEAEQAALGGVLLDAVPVMDYALNSQKITADSFSARAHQLIFETAKKMISEGALVDALTLAGRMESAGTLESIGGRQYLSSLIDAIPTPAHAPFYFDIVRQKHILRRIIEKCEELKNEAKTADRGDEILQTVPARFAEIIEEVSKKRTTKQVVDEVIQRWRTAHDEKKFSGLPTPWESLNALTCGLQPGIYILAARPSQGKTTVEDQLSEFLAGQGIPVARATLDMTLERLFARTISRKAGVSLPKLNSGHAGENQLSKAAEAAELIQEYPMQMTDELFDLDALVTWVRAMKIKHDIQLFTLDYVQNVEVANIERGMNENQILTKISRAFKKLALQLKIPIMLLSQLNRNSDKDDRIPSLADLRGSGSLEQDANLVILLYRDKKEPDHGDKRPQWMDVAKNQDGQTRTVPFFFWPNYFRFDEAELHPETGAWREATTEMFEGYGEDFETTKGNG